MHAAHSLFAWFFLFVCTLLKTSLVQKFHEKRFDYVPFIKLFLNSCNLRGEIVCVQHLQKCISPLDQYDPPDCGESIGFLVIGKKGSLLDTTDS